MVAVLILGCGGGSTPDVAGTSSDVSDDTAAMEPWAELTLDYLWGKCSLGTMCRRVLTLAPSGAISIANEGREGTKKLSDDDLAAVDAIVSTAAFRQGLALGFNCPGPPTDVLVDLRLRTADATLQREVTGCIYGNGGVDTPPKRLHDLLAKY